MNQHSAKGKGRLGTIEPFWEGLGKYVHLLFFVASSSSLCLLAGSLMIREIRSTLLQRKTRPTHSRTDFENIAASFQMISDASEIAFYHEISGIIKLVT
jgi:hypothetical protein